MDYLELGHDYLDKLQPQRLTRYLVKRLESLSHEVTLHPVNQTELEYFQSSQSIADHLVVFALRDRRAWRMMYVQTLLRLWGKP